MREVNTPTRLVAGRETTKDTKVTRNRLAWFRVFVASDTNGLLLTIVGLLTGSAAAQAPALQVKGEIAADPKSPWDKGIQPINSANSRSDSADRDRSRGQRPHGDVHR
jgi:hypothetical protein